MAMMNEDSLQRQLSLEHEHTMVPLHLPITSSPYSPRAEGAFGMDNGVMLSGANPMLYDYDDRQFGVWTYQRLPARPACQLLQMDQLNVCVPDTWTPSGYDNDNVAHSYQTSSTVSVEEDCSETQETATVAPHTYPQPAAGYTHMSPQSQSCTSRLPRDGPDRPASSDSGRLQLPEPGIAMQRDNRRCRAKEQRPKPTKAPSRTNPDEIRKIRPGRKKGQNKICSIVNSLTPDDQSGRRNAANKVYARRHRERKRYKLEKLMLIAEQCPNCRPLWEKIQQQVDEEM